MIDKLTRITETAGFATEQKSRPSFCLFTYNSSLLDEVNGGQDFLILGIHRPFLVKLESFSEGILQRKSDRV